VQTARGGFRVQQPPATRHGLLTVQPVGNLFVHTVVAEQVYHLPLSRRTVVEILKCVPSPTELGILLKGPVEERVPVVLA
jgi:hypothetical protein